MELFSNYNLLMNVYKQWITTLLNVKFDTSDVVLTSVYTHMIFNKHLIYIHVHACTWTMICLFAVSYK